LTVIADLISLAIRLALVPRSGLAAVTLDFAGKGLVTVSIREYHVGLIATNGFSQVLRQVAFPVRVLLYNRYRSTKGNVIVK
jgi:hypothetical protein